MNVISILLALIVLAWLVAFMVQTDFGVPVRRVLNEVKSVLLVFPHPDDEALSVSGVIHGLSDDVTSTLLVLTTGDAGESSVETDDLAGTRRAEMQRVADILDVDRLIQKDMGDGTLSGERDAVRQVVRETLDTVKPDLVITFDPSGMYGHPDHVATSEIVTELANDSWQLWYVTHPARIYAMATLPEEMADDRIILAQRTVPTHRIPVGISGVVAKIRALYTHASQRKEFRKAFPQPVPVWFYVSAQLYEHFYEVRY